MFVITYKTRTKGFKIHGPKTGVLGVVVNKNNLMTVMDDIAMNSIQNPYANPFHNNFKVKSAFASVSTPGSEPAAMFGIVCENDKGEEVKDIYIADWVEKLD